VEDFARTAEEGTPMSAETTFTAFVQAYNAHDADKMGQVLAADVTEDQLDLIKSTGSGPVIGVIKALWRAYSELRITNVEVLASGDTFVSYKATVSGTHTGSLTAPDGTTYAPSGNRVQADVLGFMEVRDERITRMILAYNSGQVFAQIRGEVKAPAS